MENLIKMAKCVWSVVLDSPKKKSNSKDIVSDISIFFMSTMDNQILLGSLYVVHINLCITGLFLDAIIIDSFHFFLVDDILNERKIVTIENSFNFYLPKVADKLSCKVIA